MRLQNPDRDLRFHDEASIVPGQFVLTATHFLTPVPVGTVWYAHSLKDCIAINHIYVYEHYRRCGVATALLNRLRLMNPDEQIFTCTGNHLSTPWLIKNGFHKTEVGWFLPAGASPIAMPFSYEI